MFIRLGTFDGPVRLFRSFNPGRPWTITTPWHPTGRHFKSEAAAVRAFIAAVREEAERKRLRETPVSERLRVLVEAGGGGEGR